MQALHLNRFASNFTTNNKLLWKLFLPLCLFLCLSLTLSISSGLTITRGRFFFWFLSLMQQCVCVCAPSDTSQGAISVVCISEWVLGGEIEDGWANHWEMSSVLQKIRFPHPSTAVGESWALQSVRCGGKGVRWKARGRVRAAGDHGSALRII